VSPDEVARSASPGDAPALLRAERITKTFPGTTALEEVDFEAHAGAVNGLIGENGAGKSTLMKILAGVFGPTSGRILLDGKPVSFRSVHDATAQGIGIVFQELNLCPNLSVAENIFLTHPLTRARVHIDRRRQAELTRALMRRLEHDIAPETLVSDLRIGEQQIVEIAKALSQDVRVLILDEPTSALSASEVDVLFRVIADLRRSGVALIYISHRLEELKRIADFVTILRDGRLQSRARMADVDVPWIIEQMVGRTMQPEPRPPRPAGAEVLRLERVSLPKPGGGFLVDHVDLTIRAGEMVGVYGLMGAGRSELFECLIGLRPGSGGRVFLGGQPVERLAVAERIRRGIYLVPEDRQRDGLLPNLSVAKNLTISSLWQWNRVAWIDRPREREAVERMVKTLHIKVSSPDVEVTALSGGNQQKVIIGKSLLTTPKLLLLDEPTRGIDIGAKAEVFKTMRLLADAGLAVVFATSDLKEALSAADRVVVMSRGRVTGDLVREQATEEGLVAASTLTLPSALPAPTAVME
jgi:erythritol transport system ATP-binding protein